MTKLFIILIRMAIKNCIALQLNVIDDFQATNRKQEGLSVRPPPLPRILLLAAWESYKPPNQPEYKKHHHKQVDALTFLLKIRIKQHFFRQKTLTRYDSNTFVRTICQWKRKTHTCRL
jgi:hypothetical protein